MDSKRRRLTNLWKEDPRCRDCNKMTWIAAPGINEKPGDDLSCKATLEHVISRLNPMYGKVPQSTTLLCFPCNQANGRRDEQLYGSNPPGGRKNRKVEDKPKVRLFPEIW